MKRPGRRTLLFALPVLAIAFVALVAVSNLLLRGARVDLTEHNQYTLSAGTLRIIDRVPEPITLDLFYSEKAAQSQPQFRVFSQRVRELLEEPSRFEAVRRCKSQHSRTPALVQPVRRTLDRQNSSGYALDRLETPGIVLRRDRRP